MNAYTKEWWQKNADSDSWTHISTVKMANTNPIIFINGVQLPDEPMRIETETRTMHGCRYHTVAPLNAAHLWPEMMQWVIDMFGPSSPDGVWTPGYPWYANNAQFWFRNEEDMHVFLLRWSGQ
jgi:hypothetical protein